MSVKEIRSSFQQELPKNESPINTLPDELYFQISSYLEIEDLSNLALVNSRFGRLTRDTNFLGARISQKAFKILSKSSGDKIEQEAAKNFLNSEAPRSITELDLSNLQMTDDLLDKWLKNFRIS